MTLHVCVSKAENVKKKILKCKYDKVSFANYVTQICDKGEAHWESGAFDSGQISY